MTGYCRWYIITIMPVEGFITYFLCLLDSERRSVCLPSVNTPGFDRLKLAAACNCECYVIRASIYIYIYIYIYTHTSQLENAVYCVLHQDARERAINCWFYTAYDKFVVCIVVNSKYFNECSD